MRYFITVTMVLIFLSFSGHCQSYFTTYNTDHYVQDGHQWKYDRSSEQLMWFTVTDTYVSMRWGDPPYASLTFGVIRCDDRVPGMICDLVIPRYGSYSSVGMTLDQMMLDKDTKHWTLTFTDPDLGLLTVYHVMLSR